MRRDRLHEIAFVAFAILAIAGAAVSVVAPVPFMRLLGVVAALFAAAGCALQAYALQHFEPMAFAYWRRRTTLLGAQLRALLARAAPRAPWTAGA